MIASLALVLSLAAGGPVSADAQATREIELRFVSGATVLAGTLVLPAGEGPHPAIAITHGSEPANRKNPGYRRLAASFAERGVAALIYDKRGVGDSEGTYVEAPDLRVPCTDLIAAFSCLRERPEIDGDRIGVWGASQGGWVGPMAAAIVPEIRFVVSVSGPGVSPLEQNLYDKGNQLRARGFSDEDVEAATALRRAFWGYLTTGEGYEEAVALRDAARGKPWYTREAFPIPLGPREKLLQYPRLRQFAIHSDYDPRTTLEQVRCPVLAIFGAADTIVPVERSVERMTEAFDVAGNDAVTFRIYPDADHGVRVASGRGMPAFAPGYQEDMVDWVVQQVEG